MALIELKDLRVTAHGRPILSSVSLTISSGECLGLIGASGAGKSMLALALMGLLPDDFDVSGSLFLNGKRLDIQNDAMMRDHRGGDLAMIFQEPMTALNPIRSIGAQLVEAAQLAKGISRAEAYDLAAAALIRVGLPPDIVAMDSIPDALSGGQRQRVMIASAIIAGPALLIADEPTTSLDTVTQREILDLIKTLGAEDNMAILLVSHDLAIMAEMAQRILVMDDGQIIDHADHQPFGQYLTHPLSKKLMTAVCLNPSCPPLPASPAAIMTTTGLSKSYRSGWDIFGQASRQKTILDDLSFTLRQGECLGLVGASGAGKSTASRLLLGLEAADKGEITLDGEAFRHGQISRQQRRRLNAVFQDPFAAFNPRHSVRRIIAEPLALMPTRPSADEITQLVAASLDQVGLEAAAMGRYIHEFSGGQRQRIAIARAIITRPEIIIFDEAVSSLDTLSRQHILELITDLIKTTGLSAIFISHDLAVIRAICHRVMVMDQGEIVEMGDTNKIFDQPSHAATTRLLAAIPDPAKLGFQD
jgi:peptide/nickel transport system ATP-binding protein